MTDQTERKPTPPIPKLPPRKEISHSDIIGYDLIPPLERWNCPSQTVLFMRNLDKIP
jgi:hypothetical protein